ncbi:transmembrane protein 6/97 [Gigaspora rosea]|uniref:Efficient mitochondria targeting-associated protein 19 n=1 Tax=Gigaspora rosea TaxID=44941 RepID=A0A397VH65_9GLOM|nr:transmembrane protein 6/97 [Gigaspora rosea]
MASLFSRPLDLVYVIYFISHIIASVLIDTYPLHKSFAPSVLTSLNQWYIENFNDPFFVKSPTWFISCLYMEALLIPLMVYLTIGLLKDNSSVRLPMLIYSAHVSTTTFECLSELFFGDHEELLKNQRNLLLSFYFPYFMIPFICLIDSFFRIRTIESVALQKKNK